MEQPSSEYAIAVTGVGLIRSGNPLLKDLTWRVAPDERWVVLGPNGSGKTTLMTLAAAQQHPTTGTVDVLGERLGRTDLRELRTRIGMTSAALAERIPATERVRDLVVTAAWSVVGRFQEQYDPVDLARAEELLAQLGVAGLADRAYGTLSEGERKRVQIARALMPDPELLLLDEPAAGLDLGAREELVSRLAALAADPDGPTLVLVTHHVEEIPPSFTHLMALRRGRVVDTGELPGVLDAELLSLCFGLPLHVERHGDGRFSARRATAR